MFVIKVQGTQLLFNRKYTSKEDIPNNHVGKNIHEDKRRLKTNTDDLIHGHKLYVTCLKYVNH